MAERRRGASMDPAELWRQWFEAGTGVWSDVLRGQGENYLDPYGLYRQWFEGMEILQRRMMGAAEGAGLSEGADPQEMWRRWFDATVESWEKSAELGQEMLEITPRWMEMLDQARANLMSVGSFPKDPLEFAVQWYNAPAARSPSSSTTSSSGRSSSSARATGCRATRASTRSSRAAPRST